MTEERHMWTYWRDKYGTLDALKDHYPQTIERDFRLAIAVAQIDIAMLAIEKIMGDDE